jgi:hypothetical protein
LKVKESNILFKQINLSAVQLISNLRILLKNSSLDVTCSVSLDDLDKVIGVSGEEEVDIKNNSEKTISLEEEVDESEEETPQQQVASSFQAGPWPPKLGDHLAVNIEDGVYLGEVVEMMSAETVKVSYMLPKNIPAASAELNLAI